MKHTERRMNDSTARSVAIHLAEDAELAAGALQRVGQRRLQPLRRRQLGAARLGSDRKHGRFRKRGAEYLC